MKYLGNFVRVELLCADSFFPASFFSSLLLLENRDRRGLSRRQPFLPKNAARRLEDLFDFNGGEDDDDDDDDGDDGDVDGCHSLSGRIC